MLRHAFRAFSLIVALFLLPGCGDSSSAVPVAPTTATLSRETPVPALLDEKGVGGEGDTRGLYILGAKYADGIGVTRDSARAAHLWRRAAEQGNADAQTSLGWLYTLGEGVPRDPVVALDWYRRAALQGHAAGQLYLGVKLRDGEGVAKDTVLAYAWMSLAAAGAGPVSTIRQAIRIRDSLANELSTQQRAEGERLAAGWRKGELMVRSR